MQRYFVLREQMTETDVRINGEDVKHIVKVMRMSVGDNIICSNNSSRTVRCRITTIAEDEVTASITEELYPETELPIKITIAQALPKGDKLDLIVQKGTELGAYAIQPFLASRSIVKWDQKKAKKKRERLEKIAKEAAEQSYRENIPIIADVISVAELLKTVGNYDKIMIAYEEEAKKTSIQPLVRH